MAREKKRFPFSSLSEKNWGGGFSWLLLFARYRLVSKAADRRRRFSRRCKGTTFFQNSKANTEKRVNKNFPIFFEDWKVFEHSNLKYKYNRNPQEAREKERRAHHRPHDANANVQSFASTRTPSPMRTAFPFNLMRFPFSRLPMQ